MAFTGKASYGSDNRHKPLPEKATTECVESETEECYPEKYQWVIDKLGEVFGAWNVYVGKWDFDRCLGVAVRHNSCRCSFTLSDSQDIDFIQSEKNKQELEEFIKSTKAK